MIDYKYRLLTTEDLSEINNLYLSVFKEVLPEFFFRWKYFENPNGIAILAGAFYENKLVGYGAMMPEKLNCFNDIQIAYKYIDMMTHPNHQMKGLSKIINNFLNDKVALLNNIFSYTICSRIATKSLSRNNWKYISTVTNLFKPRLFLKVNFTFKKVNLNQIKLFDSGIMPLSDYIFKNNKSNISIHRTIHFLKWRISNPKYIYQMICHYNNNQEINGYLLFSISPNNLLNVIDIHYCGNETISDSLLKYAEFLVIKRKYKGIVILTLKNSNFFAYLKKRWYLENLFNIGPLKTILYFNVKSHNDELHRFSNIANWDICGLNYDDI